MSDAAGEDIYTNLHALVRVQQGKPVGAEREDHVEVAETIAVRLRYGCRACSEPGCPW